MVLSAALTTAVLATSPNGIITSWSSGAQRLYGWTSAEVLGQSLLMLVPVERREEFEQLERQLRDGEHPDSVDTVRVAKDGRRVEVELTVLVPRDEAGRITGTVRLHHDRGPLRRAQQALLAAERGVDDGFSASPVPQARLRPDGVVLTVNRVMEQLLGIPAEALVGVDGMTFLATLAGRSVTVHRSVGGRDWESHFRPLRDGDGHVGGGIGIAVDVTERATPSARWRPTRPGCGRCCATPTTS